MPVIRLATAVAALLFGSSAAAAGPYVGFETGVSSGRTNDIDENVVYRTGPSSIPSDAVNYDDVFSVQYDRGVDVDVIAGYDFGWLKLEGELGHKRLGLKRNVEDETAETLFNDLNDSLERAAGGPGLGPITIADFQPKGTLKVNTVTANVLIDLGLGHGVTISGGGGLGRSFASGFGGHDGAGSWQYMVGARYAVRRNVEVGLKYRYFNSGVLTLVGDPVPYAGNGSVVALVTPTMQGRFRSRNLVLGMTYNFR